MKKTVVFISAILVFLSGCNRRVSDDSRMIARLDSLSSRLDSCQNTQHTEEANKKLVADMYQEIFGDKNIDAADKYIVEDYIQHNPLVADGRQALKTALSAWFRNAPKEKVDIQRIGADGDLVFIHTRSKRGNITSSVIDIFRIEDGMIAEHWDVIQDVPAQSANEHPMF